MNQEPATITSLPNRPTLDHLADQFLSTFVSANTQQRYAHALRSLLSFATDASYPEHITDTLVQQWIGSTDHLANNTLRSNITAARSFLHWCTDNGYATTASDRTFRRMLRSIPQTYGRVQAPNPGRWLTHDEAFGRLLDACNDGTGLGLRDELTLRLLLAGLRKHEVLTLTMHSLRRLPELHWMGKGRKQRDATLSAPTLDCLGRYLDGYRAALGRDLHDDDPLLCTANRHRSIQYGRAIRDDSLVWRIVNQRGKAADLGHLAPHDMRRTTAAILHRVRTSDGAHVFDVDDIRRILGHSSCETTQRYLDQLDRSAQDRAATILG